LGVENVDRAVPTVVVAARIWGSCYWQLFINLKETG